MVDLKDRTPDAVSRPGGAGSRRPARRRLDRTLWLVGPGVVFLLLTFIYPSVYGIVLSFRPQNSHSFLGNYTAFFADPYMRDSVWNTFRIALPVAILSLAMAVPLALVVRTSRRGERFLSTVAVIPLTFGAILSALALLNFLGPNGWFNRALMAMGIIDKPVTLIHNFWGVIIAQLIANFPLAFLLTLSFLSGINPVLEICARTLGANAWKRFTRITLPLLLPGLSIVFCLVFVEAFSVFPSAVMVGNPSGDSHVLAVTAANAAFQQYDYSLATSISVITGLCELVVVGAVLGLRSRLYKGAGHVGKG